MTRLADAGSTLEAVSWSALFWLGVIVLVVATVFGLRAEARERSARRAEQERAAAEPQCRHYMRPTHSDSTGTTWKCQLCPTEHFIPRASRP